jgi:ribonucleoside-diphosphate reductase alpha chain
MNASPFLTPLAVEAWDAWFRWRDHGQLRDVTVDSTWDRVATFLAQRESGIARMAYRRRLCDAFEGWQLLLDERVLASAGTAECEWPGDDLVGVINVARHVTAPCSRDARFDRAAFEATADLAVRALDDAIGLRGDRANVSPRLRIGVIGMGDALALLGLCYDSAPARAQVALVAQSLAQGCLRGSLALAHDRGARLPCDDAWIEQQRRRGTPADLLRDAAGSGLRHPALTAITSQQRMAWFANDVSDALDPLRPGSCIRSVACDNGTRCVQSDGYARTLGRRIGMADLAAAPFESVSIAAQLRLRAAAAPFVDEKILYPVRVAKEPDIDTIAASIGMAHELGLGEFAWRLCESDACLHPLTEAPAFSMRL